MEEDRVELGEHIERGLPGLDKTGRASSPVPDLQTWTPRSKDTSDQPSPPPDPLNPGLSDSNPHPATNIPLPHSTGPSASSAELSSHHLRPSKSASQFTFRSLLGVKNVFASTHTSRDQKVNGETQETARGPGLGKEGSPVNGQEDRSGQDKRSGGVSIGDGIEKMSSGVPSFVFPDARHQGLDNVISRSDIMDDSASPPVPVKDSIRQEHRNEEQTRAPRSSDGALITSASAPGGLLSAGSESESRPFSDSAVTRSVSSTIPTSVSLPSALFLPSDIPPPTPSKPDFLHPSSPLIRSSPSLSSTSASPSQLNGKDKSRTPSPLFGRSTSRTSAQLGGVTDSWIRNGTKTISPSKTKRGGMSKEDLVGRVKAALFGHATGAGSITPPRKSGNGDGNVFTDMRYGGNWELASGPTSAELTNVNGVGGTDARPPVPKTGNGLRGSQRSGKTIRRSTIHASGGADEEQGSWIVSVGWPKGGRLSRVGLSGMDLAESKVDVYVSAPTHQDTLIRGLGEVKHLDEEVRRHVRIGLPPFPAADLSPQESNGNEPTCSPSSHASRSTSSLGVNGSPGKKSRQSSFLSAFSTKIRSTIKGPSGRPASPIKRPSIQARDSDPKARPTPNLLATAPKRATIHLSDGEGLGLGHFDFEGGNGAESPSLLDPTDLARTPSPVEMASDVRRENGPGEAARDFPGLSFEGATALVSAMAENADLAHAASLPASSIASSTGVPPTPVGAVGGLAPPMTLTEALLSSPIDLEGSELAARKSDEHDLATRLSEYLAALANNPDVRALRAWKLFMQPRDADLTQNNERQERADWQAHGEEILAKNSPFENDAGKETDLMQSKKALRRSRSLGSGILAGIFGPKEGMDRPSPVATISPEPNTTPTDKRLPPPPAQTTETSSPAEDLARLIIGRDSVRAAADLSLEPLALPAQASPEDIEVGTAIKAQEPGLDLQQQGFQSPQTASITSNLSLTSRSDTQPTSPNPSDFSPHRSRTESKAFQRGRRGVKVNDFDLLKVLGRGCAGKVVLVKHKATERLFAMKIIVKKHVLAHSELQHTLTEQSVLRKMAEKADDMEEKNPFVVKMWYSFFDHDNLYLVLDFHPGGDLATQLSRWGRLGRDRARFYASEIVEGVEGLHSAGVIYRDLKPENVLLGADGHIVLVDFGLAAWFPDSKGPTMALPQWMGGSAEETDHGRRPSLDRHASAGAAVGVAPPRDTAMSFVGTAEYLAPEVIKGDPYSYEVDWWSLGTMLYEALMGSTPFWAESHADMYTRVVHEQLAFPDSSYLDKDTRSFLRGLLQKDPSFRLCEPRIKKHPYLSMVDFDHVRHKRYIPPYIPPTDSTKDFDTQNFDKQFLELSPALGDDGPGDDASQTDGGEGEGDTTKPEVVVDDSVFSGYIFKDRQIVSMYVNEEVGVDVEGAEPERESMKGSETEAEVETPTAAQPSEGVNGLPEVPPVAISEPIRLEAPPAEDEMTEPAEVVDTSRRTSVTEDDARTLDAGTTTAAPTTAMLQRIHSIASADHIKASNRHSRDFTTAGRASMEQLNRLASPLSRLDIEVAQPRDSLDDEWDLIDDKPEQAENGGETFFGRGVVDKYKLALLRRKESTVRRKPSSNLRRSPSSSLFFAGGGQGTSSNVFKSRLNLRAKSPKKGREAPPISRGASQSRGIAIRTSLDNAQAGSPVKGLSRHASDTSEGGREPRLTALGPDGNARGSSPVISAREASSASQGPEPNPSV